MTLLPGKGGGNPPKAVQLAQLRTILGLKEQHNEAHAPTEATPVAKGKRRDKRHDRKPLAESTDRQGSPPSPRYSARSVQRTSPSRSGSPSRSPPRSPRQAYDIVMSEMRQAYEAVMAEMGGTDTDAAFDLIDVNRDGVIDHGEFMKALQRTQTSGCSDEELV